MPMKLCLLPESTRLERQIACHHKKSKISTKPSLAFCAQQSTAKVPALTPTSAPMASLALLIPTSAWLTAAASRALSVTHPSSALPSGTVAAISAPPASNSTLAESWWLKNTKTRSEEHTSELQSRLH